jgi:transposase InsO family protein
VWFARLGVLIQQVMSDNAFAYLSHAYRTAVRAIGARHIRSRPYTPRTKAERFIQTCLREWVYRRAYRSSAGRKAGLAGVRPPLRCRAAAHLASAAAVPGSLI